MKLLYRFFRSKRLAWILLAAVALAAGMGNTVPQTGRDEFSLAAWQRTHPVVARLLSYVDGYNVFRSWWFVSLLVLLMFNTLACSLGMALALKRRGGWLKRNVATVSGGTGEPINAPTEAVKASLLRRLTARGFSVNSVEAVGGEVIRAEKYPWGEWTGIFFHVCLVMLFALAALNSVLSWRGFVVLTEGDGLAGGATSMHALAGRNPSGQFHLDVKLLSFNPRNKVKNYMAEPGSRLMVGSGSTAKEVSLTTEGGRRLGRISIYQGLRYGVTFFLAEESVPGAPVFRISLPAQDVADQVIADSLSPSGRGILLQPAFTELITENKRPLADRFAVRLADARPVKRGERLSSTPIRVGQAATLGSARLRLLQMRYWASYSLVYNPLLPPAYAVAWLAIGWLMLGFFCYSRRLSFVVRADGPGRANLFLQVDGVRSRWLVKREGEAILESVREEVSRHE